MIEIQKKSKCTGCGACANACPTSAIEMTADDEGFSYPIIDNDKCVDCGKCQSICPTIKENQKGVISPSYKTSYLCFCNDESIRMDSSSGGIFYPLAMQVLSDGGVVFGAKFDDNWNVIHAVATDEAGVKAFQVSKYVQSDIGDTYKEAKSYLDADKPVLFTGTPCQIAGLKSYLGRIYPKLITCDFICHGVPSPEVWQDYVKYREEKAGAKAARIAFRVKDEGWLKSFFFFFFLNRNEYRQYKTKDIYYKGFLNNLFVRPCCHHCSFKGFNRASDITIADAWGIKKYAPEFYNEKGVSFIIIHTERGKAMFRSISEAITYKDIEMERPIKHNYNFYNSEVKSLLRGKFFKNWKLAGIESAIENNLKFYDKCYRKGASIISKVFSMRRTR